MRLLPLLLLTSCAAGSPRQADLSEELAGRSAGPPQDCVPVSAGAGLAPRDSMTLVYRRGDTIWLNHLAATCPALRPTATLIVEAHGSQYCRGDRFRTVEPGQSIPGRACVLGSFTPWRR